ncbi:MAG TPA: RHS repeat-associated core domain-containing protein [Nonomuraea sp.]|nr:RHS repeat-associated core domain-containing protein [Nonomuraea sp.]
MNTIIRSSWIRRTIAAVLVTLVAVPLVGAPAASAAAPDWEELKAPQVKGVEVHPVRPERRDPFTADEHAVRGEPKVAWPDQGEAVIDRVDGGPVRAGKLPVTIGAPEKTAKPSGRVAVRMYDKAAADRAGLDGVLLSVAGLSEAGAVEVGLDYAAFKDAYGGDWSSRLRLVQVPACALTTPQAAGCAQATLVKTRNDLGTSRLTATVPLAAGGEPTVLAATAAASGDDGDYKATSLKPAATWEVSPQTGDFTWTYPIDVPGAQGGPEPTLELAYNSGSVDGRTGATNSQASWIGDGWELWPGYVERQYRTCDEDKATVGGQDPNNKSLRSGDLCWFDDNATLYLNGGATELVKGSDGAWHGASDDGSRIERFTGASNGDDDGEYWRVTTLDGTQYFFGKQTASESAWTAPVYANHPGEHCHATAFADSGCTQAWRWNLDHVVDPHGNTMSYFYGKESGAYGREGEAAKRTTYVRGGWLSRIDYGTRSGSTAPASARVVFDVTDRCADGATCDATHPASWPDTPWDLFCKDAPCAATLSPTFWTQKRLSRIRTQVHDGSSYNDVDSYALRASYLDVGDGSGKPLWLQGIAHTGEVTTAGGPKATEPEITFDPGQQAPANRVDGPADGRSELARWRIGTIITESGARISVKYSENECTRSSLPDPHANTKLCFPAFYAPEGEEPKLDWFHKRVVTRVDVDDDTEGFDHEQTDYLYLDKPAWHYDDSQLVPVKKRTWGQFRGYGKVQVRKGVAGEPQSLTQYLYLRGMDGDRQPSGVRNVVVEDSQGGNIEDHEAYNGFLREQITFDGTGGAVVSGELHTPWRRGPIATSGPLKAWMVNTATSRVRTSLSSGATRWARVDTTYNDDGLPVQVDELGDESTAADDTCERTEYARNTTAWILNTVKRVENVGVRCSTTPARPGDVLSDQRTYYDDPEAPWGAPPTRGNVVKIEQAASWNGSTPIYAPSESGVYDANGREVESYDAIGRKTSTAYTPALAGPVTRVVTTNAAGHRTVETRDPASGEPVKLEDPNGQITEMAYDGLGQLLKVWLPDRPRASMSPSLQFEYLLRANASTAVTTRKLLPDEKYRTTVTLYDGLLRERQIQTQAPGGGRIVSDTVYNSRGLVAWTSVPFYDMSNAPPSATLVTTTGTPEIPAVTEMTYDGAERKTKEVFLNAGDEKWRTTTSYGGDRVTVLPPAGGIATTTVSDALGRTTELRQYHARGSAGSNDPATYDRTSYTYTDRGELQTVTDQAGNTWRYHYDQRGRKWKDEDPDKGVTVSTYDDADQTLTTTDARNVTLGYTYDALGRKTSIRDGSVTGAKRAEWVYDTLPNGIGRVTRSVRYEGGNPYVNEVTGYDVDGRKTGAKVVVPAAETGLAGTYVYGTTYRANGQIHKTTLPAAGDLPAETLTYGYDDVGNQTDLFGLGLYVRSAEYDKLGNLSMRELGEKGKRVQQTFVTNERTGRLDSATAVPELKNHVYNLAYTYADAGNLTKIADTPNGGQPADTQCYDYDHLQRLTRAWTPSSGNCATAPTVAGLGGPAPYWRDYVYDVTGNRKSEVSHAAAGNTTSTYTYPQAGTTRPHGLTQVSTTSPSGPRTDTFGYDAAGNTTTRNGTTLTWDNDGSLKTSGTDSYLYDADDTRLIRRTAQGRTLYLPDGTEVFAAANGTRTATRYYNHAGDTVAVRTSGGLTWLTSDHHDTADVNVSSTDLKVTRRRTLPFGAVRGAAPATWAGNRGFVNGTIDPGGLTHLGAREYDPALGRFVSVDPLVDVDEPQSLNAYAYGNNAPPTFADPDGLMMNHDDGNGGGSSAPPAQHKPAKCRWGDCSMHGSTPGAWISMRTPAARPASPRKEAAKRPPNKELGFFDKVKGTAYGYGVIMWEVDKYAARQALNAGKAAADYVLHDETLPKIVDEYAFGASIAALIDKRASGLALSTGLAAGTLWLVRGEWGKAGESYVGAVFTGASRLATREAIRAGKRAAGTRAVRDAIKNRTPKTRRPVKPMSKVLGTQEDIAAWSQSAARVTDMLDNAYGKYDVARSADSRLREWAAERQRQQQREQVGPLRSVGPG